MGECLPTWSAGLQAYFSRAESRHTRSVLLSREEMPVSLYMHFTAILRYLYKWEYFTIGKPVSEMDTHYEEPSMNFFQRIYSKKSFTGQNKNDYTLHNHHIIKGQNRWIVNATHISSFYRHSNSAVELCPRIHSITKK